MLARVKVDPGGNSPQWLVTSLLKAGIRSVSPVVDVTNYVMLELGQPLHAYDAAKVQLPLIVRPAQAARALPRWTGKAPVTVKRPAHYRRYRSYRLSRGNGRTNN